MAALEPLVVELVISGRLTAAIVLLRSHAETAGVAALAITTLWAGDYARLRDVMQKLLYGSSIAKGWKNQPGLSDFVALNESKPVGAGELMNALDRFADAGGKGNGRYRGIYGILCEYAHPNMRGVAGFARLIEEQALGVRVRYEATEEVGAHDQVMVFSVLAEMMRLGHSASELLRLGQIVQRGDSFQVLSPTPTDMHRILSEIMLLKDETSIH